VNFANTIPDDILLNGGAIPSMMTFSEDILIYDKNSLLSSLTSAQAQPIIPLQAASLSGAIDSNAKPSGNEANLLVSANPSPSQLPTSGNLSGTSTK